MVVGIVISVLSSGVINYMAITVYIIGSEKERKTKSEQSNTFEHARDHTFYEFECITMMKKSIWRQKNYMLHLLSN